MLMIPSGSGYDVLTGYCDVMDTGVPHTGGECNNWIFYLLLFIHFIYLNP